MVLMMTLMMVMLMMLRVIVPISKEGDQFRISSKVLYILLQPLQRCNLEQSDHYHHRRDNQDLVPHHLTQYSLLSTSLVLETL